MAKDNTVPLNELTTKQEKFIQNIVSGMSQRQAYKEAFNVDYDDNAIDVNACKLFNETKIQLRYKELLEEIKDAAIMTAKERMIWLTEVVKDIQKEKGYTMFGDEYEKTANFKNKLNAIDILNKMSGEYKTILEGNVGINSKKFDEICSQVGGDGLDE